MGYFLFNLGGLMMIGGLIARLIAARSYSRVAKAMSHREDGPEPLSLFARALPLQELPKFCRIAYSHKDPDIRKSAKKVTYGELLFVILWIAGITLFFLGATFSN